MIKFYTYLWLREDGTPYYVGKGSGKRAFISQYHNVHKPQNSELILVQEFPSEQDALSAEKFLIAYYGRKDKGEGPLRNRTEGGEGTSGYKYTEEAKAKVSKAQKGVKDGPQSEETKLKRSKSLKGKKNALGFKHTEEAKQKIRKARVGQKDSEEVRKRKSEAAFLREQRKHSEGNKRIDSCTGENTPQRRLYRPLRPL